MSSPFRGLAHALVHRYGGAVPGQWAMVPADEMTAVASYALGCSIEGVQERLDDWRAGHPALVAAPLSAVIAKCRDEWGELMEADAMCKGQDAIAEEVADNFVMLFHLASLLGVNVADALEAKMLKLASRTYDRVDQTTGAVSHRREG